MPTQSENYQLSVGMVTDDFIEPQHVDRLAATVDKVLGSVVKRLLQAGVYSGWLLQNDKTVSAGSGLVNGCWGETALDQAITGLTNNTVNYVFAVATSQSAPAGEVEFAAQTAPQGPTGALFLGTIELDDQGAVVAIDNQADDVARGCFPLLTDTLNGSGLEQAVEPEEEVELEIEHDALAIPGAIDFQIISEHFSFVLEETWRSDGFVARCTNEDSSAHDLEYSWERQGIRG